jgi:hypothetical protein
MSSSISMWSRGNCSSQSGAPRKVDAEDVHGLAAVGEREGSARPRRLPGRHPATPRTTSRTASGIEPTRPATSRSVSPATVSTICRKDSSTDRLTSEIPMTVVTPSETPSTVNRGPDRVRPPVREGHDPHQPGQERHAHASPTGSATDSGGATPREAPPPARASPLASAGGPVAARRLRREVARRAHRRRSAPRPRSRTAGASRAHRRSRRAGGRPRTASPSPRPRTATPSTARRSTSGPPPPDVVGDGDHEHDEAEDGVDLILRSQQGRVEDPTLNGASSTSTPITGQSSSVAPHTQS